LTFVVRSTQDHDAPRKKEKTEWNLNRYPSILVICFN